MAVVNRVQIHLQDILLAIVVVDLRREHQFVELAFGIVRIAHDQLFNQLLSNRAAALHLLAAIQVRDSRAQDAGDIHARILPERAILNRHGRVKQIRRNLFIADLGMNALIG